MDANHPATLASGFVYNAAGAVTSMDYGNGTRMTPTFNSGMQLKTLQHGPIGAPGAILNYEYGYQEGVSNTGQIMKFGDSHLFPPLHGRATGSRKAGKR